MAVCVPAAERLFNFGGTKEGESPAGFRSLVSGSGELGVWRVVSDEAPSTMPGASSNGLTLSRQSVLAQLSRDKTDERFPLLVFEEEVYGDFTFTARVKTVSGDAERMAGLAFRVQDEKNYYVVRISSLGNNIRFYKFVNGMRSDPIGPEVAVPSGVWHEISVECQGSRINIKLNGVAVMPTLNDSSFSKGKVGFWTKSDSVSHFAHARIQFTPLERLVDRVMRETLTRYSKLRGLRLYAVPPGKTQPEIVASSQPAEVGTAGGAQEKDCLENGTSFVGKSREATTVMMPVRDRNGDVVAALKVTMDTFLGQTEQNALNRARPVVKYLEGKVVRANEPLL